MVVDTAAKLEVSSFSYRWPCTLDVGADGAAVVSAGGPLINGGLRGFQLQANGVLSATGAEEEDLVLLGVHRDVDVVPDGRTVVVLDEDVLSYATHTLAPRDVLALSQVPVSGCFDAQGTRYFVRTQTAVRVLAYNPRTGDLSPLSQFSTPAAEMDPEFWAVEQMAFDDFADVLWLTTSSDLLAYDASSGALLRTIPGVPGCGIALGPAVARNRARGEPPRPARGVSVDPGD